MKPLTMIGVVSPLSFYGLDARAPRGIGDASGAWSIGDDGLAYYRVQAGDTLGALAGKYLGSWGRYMELFNAQSDEWKASRNNNPNLIRTGELMVMPSEAAQTAIRLGVLSPRAVDPTWQGPPAPSSAPIPADVLLPAMNTGPGTATIPEVEITGDPNAPDDSDDEGGAASSSGPIPTPALVAGGAVVALALWMVWRRRQRAQAFAGI